MLKFDSEAFIREMEIKTFKDIEKESETINKETRERENKKRGVGNENRNK